MGPSNPLFSLPQALGLPAPGPNSRFGPSVTSSKRPSLATYLKGLDSTALDHTSPLHSLHGACHYLKLFFSCLVPEQPSPLKRAGILSFLFSDVSVAPGSEQVLNKHVE